MFSIVERFAERFASCGFASFWEHELRGDDEAPSPRAVESYSLGPRCNEKDEVNEIEKDIFAI